MDFETTEAIKRHFDVIAEELRKEIRAGDEALRVEIRDVKRHSDVIAESLRNEIRAGDEALGVEIRDVKRHSDVIAESLRSEIRLVAEGVAGLDEKFSQEFVKVREEIGEVKGLLVVSYRDLDRRLNPS